ncbi:MAG: hypothetical protein HYU97_02230 [Deltaproteobacteria bacterium]|nr:hypothetical protein [Deltaproteobacteria bacterium]
MKILTIVWGFSLSLALLGSGIEGCGGGGSNNTSTTVSSGQGSVTAAVKAIETSLLSSAVHPNELNSSLSAENISTSTSVSDCVESINTGSTTGFTITCNCTVDGEASGTITTVFSSDRTEQSCQTTNGDSGSSSSISGNITITFDQCVIEECGESLTLTGSIQGTVEYSFSGCTSSETLTATFGTESECSGLVTTHEDSSTDTVGFSAIWSTGTSGDSQSGSACINNEVAELDDLDDLCSQQSGESCNTATVSCASDFACQLFADNNSNDAFNTDNVACVSGCCVVSETGRCSDSEDNDFDGNTDCNDSDCSADPYCQVGPCGSGTISCTSDFACQVFADTDLTDPFTTSNVSCVSNCCVAETLYETGECTDGSDNDFDGTTDCNDSDCAGDLACGARLPCTNAWQCQALAAGTSLAEATPSCLRYDTTDSRYRYNDGSCFYDCTTATNPSDCLSSCLDIAKQQSQGGFINYQDQVCRFYPPPH